MSYPKQVPPGWSRTDPVKIIVNGPRDCAIGRDLFAFDTWRGKNIQREVIITFDNVADGKAWLTWWRAGQ